MSISRSCCLLISQSSTFLHKERPSWHSNIQHLESLPEKCIDEVKLRGELFFLEEFLCFGYQDYCILMTMHLFVHTTKADKQAHRTRFIKIATAHFTPAGIYVYAAQTEPFDCSHYGVASFDVKQLCLARKDLEIVSFGTGGR